MYVPALRGPPWVAKFFLKKSLKKKGGTVLGGSGEADGHGCAAATALVIPCWLFGGERLSNVSCRCESGCFIGKFMGKGEASAAGEKGRWDDSRGKVR